MAKTRKNRFNWDNGDVQIVKKGKTTKKSKGSKSKPVNKKKK